MALTFAVAGLAPAPVAQSPGLPKVVAAGTQNVLIILADGRARVMTGSNEFGQLGAGTSAKPVYGTDPSEQLELPDIDDAVDGAAAESSFYLLRGNGHVFAWGNNQSGQMGFDRPGTVPAFGRFPPNVLRPTEIPSLAGVRQIATSGSTTFVLMDDGTVRSAGSDAEGLLGLGPAMPPALAKIGKTHYFIEIPGLKDVKAIATGGGSAFALLADGTVRAWGRNRHGSLGAEGIFRSPVPLTVAGVDNAIAIAATVDYALALRGDGTVLLWGEGTVDGTYFAGATDPAIHTEDARPWTAKPLVIPNLRNVVAISAGSNAMALLADGTVRTWGYNGHYSMGLGHNREYPRGLQTVKLQKVASIASGWNASYFVLHDGTVLKAGAGPMDGYYKVPTVIWPK